MTPTPHGQVPEALIDLIDAYAETRHRYGRIYNAKTEAARKAVIEALSGVQALSAAPAEGMTIAGDGASALGRLMREQRQSRLGVYPDGNPNAALAASPTPPAEQPIGEVVVTKDEDGQIVAVTRQDDEGHILSVIATCDPAEQQAEESRVKLLAECRDAFPIPEPSSPLEVQWAAAMARPEEVPEYVRLCVAAMQAAPKAAPARRTGTIAHIGNGRTTLVGALASVLAAPQQEAQEPATVPYQKLTNEIDLILSDPDTELSIGAKRALLWMRTWVSVPLYTAPQPAPAPLSEREAFETAWEKLHGKRPVLWSRLFAEHKMETPAHSEGNYFAATEQAAWKLWQARAALAAQGSK